MEELLHYVWKHKLFPLAPLTTTDGKSVEVVDVGLHNRHAGPDFFNAKVRIDGTLWVGNFLPAAVNPMTSLTPNFLILNLSGLMLSIFLRIASAPIPRVAVPE